MIGRSRISRANLVSELAWQMLDDGGHVTRNPGLLVELLLDLLPLSQCFTARDRKLPKQLGEALRAHAADAALSAARRRHGRALQRRRLRAGRRTRHRACLRRWSRCPRSPKRALRATRGWSAATPSSLPMSGGRRRWRNRRCAQAGCLSFEMSVGKAAAVRQRRRARSCARRLVSSGTRHGEPQCARAGGEVVLAAYRASQARSADGRPADPLSRPRRLAQRSSSTAASCWRPATTAITAATS